MPKVSVLMPIYKSEPEFLKQAISSVLNQTFTDFEFLILDDCPTDDRENIVKSFSDPRIKYFKNNQNFGISESRNKLIQLSKGQYLAVIDHDDIALPNRLKEEVNVLDSEPDIGVVSCWIERFPKIRISKYPIYNQEIEQYLMKSCCIPHTGAMIRKSALGNIRYEAKFSPAEDYRLWCQLIGRTKFHNIPKVLMKYRQYNGNTHRKQAKKMHQKTLQIWAFNQKNYTTIWDNCNNMLPHVIRFKLFGLIPLGKIHQKGKFYHGWIRFIPFISIRTKPEV